MGMIFTCDCGKQKPMAQEDLVQMGVSQKYYCKGECEEKVQEFLDKRDELHDKTVDYWNKGLKKLYSKDFQFPDEDIWTI